MKCFLALFLICFCSNVFAYHLISNPAVASGIGPIRIDPVVWLDGSDSDTVHTISTKVYAWTNKGTIEFDATNNVGAEQPTYDSVNGWLDFDGTDDMLRVPFSDQIDNGQCTYFLVFHDDAVSGFDYYWSATNRDDDTGMQSYSYYSGKVRAGFEYDNGIPTVTGADINDATVITIVHDDAGDRIYLYDDYDLVYDKENAGGTYLPQSAKSIHIGSKSDYSYARNVFNGQFKEILIYAETLSASDRNSVIDYLMDRW